MDYQALTSGGIVVIGTVIGYIQNRQRRQSIKRIRELAKEAEEVKIRVNRSFQDLFNKTDELIDKL